jgi:crotonobetainyl-CoA:carnitine CoA-transferase CaiB-like acyl-CoA transferase
MPGYSFLHGLLVVEVAQLGMDALGGYLADMGARVVKVEPPGQGDPVRFAGEEAVGGPDGVGFLHLRWNRGKQSVAIDLRAGEGSQLFKRLAARADVVVDGLKGGTLDRLGLGYESLRADNPALVYCSLSGLGLDGPYHHLRSHAVAYDAFGGLIDPAADRRPPPRGAFRAPSIGMNAPGLYAAVGVLSAVVQAQRSGAGAFIEVAAADVAANWTPNGLDAVVNRAVCVERPGFLGADGRMSGWARLAPYMTADGRTILLEALSLATWRKFCALVERPDLLALAPGAPGHAEDHASVERELAALFRTRTLEAWMALLSQHDVSAMPVNRLAELPQDPHYEARANWYEVELEGAGGLRLSGTPVRVRGADFSPRLAPMLGQDTDCVLRDLVGLDGEEIARLRASDVVA